MTIQYNPTLTGATTSYLDGTGAFSRLLDPSQFYFFFDDFTGGMKNTVNGTILFSSGRGLQWTAGLTAGGNVDVVHPADAGCFGSVAMTTTASNNAFAQITNSFEVAATSVTASTTNLNDKTFDLKYKAKISSTASISVALGVLSDFISNSMSIRFISGTDSTWTANTNIGGVITPSTITGSVLDTNYHTFRMRSVTPGTILFSVDGGTEVSMAFSASVCLSLQFFVQTLTNAAKAITVDYVWGWIKLAR